MNHVSKPVLQYILLTSFLWVACAKVDFAPVGSFDRGLNSPILDFAVSEKLPYSSVQDFFAQDYFEKNQTTLSFNVVNSKGENIKDLKDVDFKVFENGQEVKKFSLKSAEKDLGQKVDVVFVLDKTSSMGSIINDVKARVRQFVAEFERKNIQASLCMVTFDDDVGKRCNFFVEDNPATKENENLTAFVDELTKLNVVGGGDADENQLAGLIAAAKATPWHPDAQRIAILVTDIGFHFLPDNIGDAGSAAVSYEDTIRSVQDNQMMIFTVGPRIDGYYGNFRGSPSLSAIVGGDFFEVASIIGGSSNMNRVFSSIVNQIATIYTLTFISEDNGPLDPTLPLDRRSISISAASSGLGGASTYRVRMLSTASNLPAGRASYKKSWLLSKLPRKKAIELHKYSVLINGIPQTSGFAFNERWLDFENPPEPKAKISVQYYSGALRDSVKERPLLLPAGADSESLSVFYNDKKAFPEQYKISSTTNGELVVEPNELVFAESDPFDIVKNLGLNIEARGILVNEIPPKPTSSIIEPRKDDPKSFEN